MRWHGSGPNFEPFYDAPDGGSGGGDPTPPAPAPAPAPSPAPAPTGGTPGPTPSPSPTPPAGTPPVGTPPSPSSFSFPEDRSDWLPPTRAQELARQEAARHQTEAQRYRAMLEAGTGVRMPEPEAPVAPEVQQARQTMEKIYPGFNGFMQAVPYLLQVAQTMQQAQVDPRSLAGLPDVFAGTQHQWERHAQTTLEPIHQAIAQDYNLETLSPRQTRTITQDFIAWVEEDATRMQRYTRGDRNLGTEYLDDYRSGFITPLRVNSGAAAAAAGSRAAALPPAPRGSGMVAPPAPAAPLTEDQVHDAAWQTFNAARQASQ